MFYFSVFTFSPVCSAIGFETDGCFVIIYSTSVLIFYFMFELDPFIVVTVASTSDILFEMASSTTDIS